MPQLHVRTWGAGETAVFVHGSSSPDASHTWAKQRDLSDRYQLVIPSRRGYGQSPVNGFRDYQAEVRDVIGLLGSGAHLVGLSYGGVLALLAAAACPDLVRSLTVIEPPAFGAARGLPAVEELITKVGPAYAMAPDCTPEEFARAFARGLLGRELPSPLQMVPELEQAARAHMNECAPWEIPIPFKELAAARFPKLVVTGNWHPAFEALGDELAGHIGAERAVIPGAGHGVQLTGEPFNTRLLALWEGAAAKN